MEVKYWVFAGGEDVVNAILILDGGGVQALGPVNYKRSECVGNGIRLYQKQLWDADKHNYARGKKSKPM